MIYAMTTEQLAALTAVRLPVYRVQTDRQTGEWLSHERAAWPRQTVSALEWHMKRDTDEVAHDTAEIDGQTVAVQIEWVD